MIINISCQYLNEGYLESNDSDGIYYPFFPTASMAVRRKDFEEVGGFDSRLLTGEDIDLCIKLQKANKVLWYDKDAVVYHQHRSKLREILKQFYYYGYYHPVVYDNHNEKGIKIFILKKIIHNGELAKKFQKLMTIPCFFKGMIFFNYWIPTLLSIMFAIYFLVTNQFWAMIISFSLAVIFYIQLMKCWIGPDKIKLRAEIIFLQTILDISFICGGFIGGLKRGILYFEPSARDSYKNKMDFGIDKENPSIQEIYQILGHKKI